MMKHSHSGLLFLLAMCLTTAQALWSQPVIKAGKVSDLQSGCAAAFEEYRGTNGFWIGYSIQRSDIRRIIIGSWFSRDDDDAVTLRDIVDHNAPRSDARASTGKHRRFSGVMFDNGVSIDDGEGDGETAILLLYDRASKNIADIKSVTVCSLSRSIDLRGYPVCWLASAADADSSESFLASLFDRTEYDAVKKELIPAIGIHSDLPATTTFLIEAYANGAPGQGRTKSTNGEWQRSAAFWLGFQENDEALAAVKKIIDSDAPMSVRKDAVTGLSFNRAPGALELLIGIARTNDRKELRRRAIFGLSAMAAGKAMETLKGIVDDDPDIEIKKSAVYALSGMKHDVVPYLITLARSHRSVEIRKCAIYSLGSIADEAAVDALISLAQGR